jgi:phosphogluconate dehydratase
MPGAAFINPNTPLREALTKAAAKRALAITASGNEYTPVGAMIDEKSFVNCMVGLHATGGSTNHTLHLIVMAAAAGITLTWNDFADLAAVTPLLARVYPSGTADVNHFHAAGGMGFVIKELLAAGLLNGDVKTVFGTGLEAYASEPGLDAAGGVVWRPAPETSGDESVLRGVANPFQATGGLAVLDGVLGRAVIKTSAVAPERHVIEAPAKIFHCQEDVQAAFRAGALNRDVVAVVRFQGPKANGMPELHKLVPPLGVLQDKGFKVALVTDGRLSGASGKIPAAIHVTPEAADGGAIGKIRDGDIVRIDALAGTLDVAVDAAEWAARVPETVDLSGNQQGVGRELFAAFRNVVSTADTGASIFLGLAA